MNDVMMSRSRCLLMCQGFILYCIVYTDHTSHVYDSGHFCFFSLCGDCVWCGSELSGLLYVLGVITEEWNGWTEFQRQLVQKMRKTDEGGSGGDSVEKPGENRAEEKPGLMGVVGKWPGRWSCQAGDGKGLLS